MRKPLPEVENTVETENQGREAEILARESVFTVTAPMPITQIRRDRRYQIRNSLSPGAVEMYRQRYEAGADMDPIRVGVIGGNVGDPGVIYVLIDGWHRLKALELLNRTEVVAKVETCASHEVAQWRATECNRKHGVQLSRAERQKTTGVYLKTGQHFIPGRPRTDALGRLVLSSVKSYKEMGRDLGVSEMTAARWIKDADLTLWRMKQKELDPIPFSSKPPTVPIKSSRAVDLARLDIENFQAACHGITDEYERGEMVQAAEEAVVKVKAGGTFKLADF